MTWITAHPRVAVLIVALITLAFAFGLPRVGIDSSGNMLMIPGDPDAIYYDEVREVFGDDVILSIVIKAENIFQTAILQSIENITSNAEELPGVQRVISLSTVTKIRGRDGVLETDHLVPNIPTDPSELDLIRADALYQRLFHGEVISDDGNTAAVNLFVADKPDDPHFNNRLTAEVQAIIDREAKALGETVKIYQTGVPTLKVTMMEFIQRDMMRLLPFSFLVVFSTLFFLYRSVSAVVIPAVTGLVSIVITVGFMGYVGIPFNPMTAIIPLLLVVIGATEDMHLISEYGLALERGESKTQAIRSMASKGGLAVFLTSLTTILGFVTIIGNSIPILRGFGIAASFGMLVNFVVTVLLVPTLLLWLPLPTQQIASGRRQMAAATNVARTASRRRFMIVALSALLVAIGVISSQKIVNNTDYLGFFHEDAPVRQTFADIGEHLAGAHSFYVVIDTKREDGLKDPEVLREIAEFSDFIATQTDKVSGYPNLIRTTHREMNDGNHDFYAIPESTNLVAQYNLMLNQDDLDRFVDSEYSKTCLLVRTKVSGSNEIRELIPRIEQFANRYMRVGLDFKITGEMILVAGASDRIAAGIFDSLLILLGCVLVVISLLFWSVKAGLLALIPNFIPVIVNFGAMGTFGYALGPGTFPVALIAFGIAVDDTIHFMVRYHKELKSADNEIEAVERSVEKEFRPVVASSIALILGFLVLTLSDFGSTYQFGILAALSITAALLTDLYLTPVLFLFSPLISAWDYLTLKIRGDSLHESQLFKGLKLSEIKKIALAGTLVDYAKGEVVVEKGEVGADVFFVVEGSAQVINPDASVGDTTESRVLEELERGALFGEMAFISKQPRSATVVAKGPLQLIQINEGVLERLRAQNPRIAAKVFYNFSHILSDRLRKMTDKEIETPTD